jgi:hypothetical protein
MSTIIRSPQDFLTELKKMTDAKVAAPPTVDQLTAEIERLGVALDAGSAAGPTLTGAMREAVEAQRADLIRQQYILVRGFVPDENGDRPIDEQAIAASATEKVLEAISAAPESEALPLQSESVDLPAEDGDEADSEEVSLKIPPSLLAAEASAITIPPDLVMLMRAAQRANLNHVVLKVMSVVLQEN